MTKDNSIIKAIKEGNFDKLLIETARNNFREGQKQKEAEILEIIENIIKGWKKDINEERLNDYYYNNYVHQAKENIFRMFDKIIEELKEQMYEKNKVLICGECKNKIEIKQAQLSIAQEILKARDEEELKFLETIITLDTVQKVKKRISQLKQRSENGG